MKLQFNIWVYKYFRFYGAMPYTHLPNGFRQLSLYDFRRVLKDRKPVCHYSACILCTTKWFYVFTFISLYFNQLICTISYQPFLVGKTQYCLCFSTFYYLSILNKVLLQLLLTQQHQVWNWVRSLEATLGNMSCESDVKVCRSTRDICGIREICDGIP